MQHTLKSPIGPILLIICFAQAKAADKQDYDMAGWKTFKNRAGWSIRYPPDWQITSCNLCPDPTDPNVFVWFYDPQADDGVRIEHLQDKPADESVEEWLQSIARILSSNFAPGKWTWLDGRKALRAKARHPGFSDETIYVVDGSNTFSIGDVKVEDTPFYQRFLQMVSTFRFTEPKIAPRAAVPRSTRKLPIK